MPRRRKPGRTPRRSARASAGAAGAAYKRACERLARTAIPGATMVVSPAGREDLAILARHRDALLARPGVVGIGLGTRQVDRVSTGKPCIQVFVEQKRSLRGLARRGEEALPASLAAGEAALPIDVVESGTLEPLVYGGSSIGPSGVHEKATLGFIAREAVSPDVQVGVTAMHVTGLDEYDGTGPLVELACPSVVDDPSASAPFGWLARGTMTDVDAAKLSLYAPAEEFLADIGPLRGWRPTSYPADVNVPVRMVGARSGLQRGVLLTPSADFPAWRLSGALVVAIAADHGDSGAALVDDHDLLLGICTGGLPGSDGLVLFSAAGLLLGRLGCNVPYVPLRRVARHDIESARRPHPGRARPQRRRAARGVASARDRP